MDKAREFFKANYPQSYELWLNNLRQIIVFEAMEQYAQQEYERGFKDGKEVQKGWEELKDSGLDKPFNHQNQQQ